MKNYENRVFSSNIMRDPIGGQESFLGNPLWKKPLCDWNHCLLLDSETISEEEAYSGFDFCVFLDFETGYREEGVSIWFKDDKAMVLEFFSPIFSLAEIQENLVK